MVISLFSTPEHGILLQDYFPIDPAYFSKFCDTCVFCKNTISLLQVLVFSPEKITDWLG